MITIYEARHELKYGSAGYLRAITGWGLIFLWLAGVWYVATILGDWDLHGDLDAAMDRSSRRLKVLFHLLVAFGDG